MGKHVQAAALLPTTFVRPTWRTSAEDVARSENALTQQDQLLYRAMLPRYVTRQTWGMKHHKGDVTTDRCDLARAAAIWTGASTYDRQNIKNSRVHGVLIPQ